MVGVSYCDNLSNWSTGKVFCSPSPSYSPLVSTVGATDSSCVTSHCRCTCSPSSDGILLSGMVISSNALLISNVLYWSTGLEVFGGSFAKSFSKFSSDTSTGAAGPVAGRLRGGTVKHKDLPNIYGAPNIMKETRPINAILVVTVMAATSFHYIK